MIKRTMYLEKIRPFYHKNIVKVITGIRRSGKSTLLLQIVEDLITQGVTRNQIVHINLDQYESAHLKDKQQLYDYLKTRITTTHKTYIFLDEIQEVTQFETIINSINSYESVDIYLTGSNSKMLSSEYATYLTGRYVSFEVFPFSFKEMCIYHENKNPQQVFIDYVTFGGFPQVQLFSQPQDKKALLMDLYNSIVIKDLSERYNIKDISVLERYLLYINNTISSLFTAENISAYFKSEGRTIAKETLYNYIKYAKDSFFVYSAQRYDIRGKRLLTTNEKLFINDQGFRGLFFSNQADIEKILENIVYFELLRRNYQVFVGNVGENEIDFICIKNESRIYIQVAYILATPSTVEREFNALLKINDQYPKYVISTDVFNQSRDGIIHMNIMDFLLDTTI